MVTLMKKFPQETNMKKGSLVSNKFTTCSAGMIKDLSLIKFAITVLNSGSYEKSDKNELTEQNKKISIDIQNINSEFALLLITISKKDKVKIEKKYNKVLNYFIRKTLAAKDVDNVAVELFAAYILKYRFSMFKSKTIDSSFNSIVERARLNNIIKNVITDCKIENEDREFSFEIELAKDISKVF